MKVISKRRIGKYPAGVPFEFPDKAARAMIKVGKFTEYKEPVQAEAVAKEEVRISPTTGKPVRQYSRRDMRAED